MFLAEHLWAPPVTWSIGYAFGMFLLGERAAAGGISLWRLTTLPPDCLLWSWGEAVVLADHLATWGLVLV